MTDSSREARKPPRKPIRRWALGCAGALVVAAALVLALHRPILHAVALHLVCAEEPRDADLVVVHAGEPDRVAWGAKLVREGHAPHLLVFLDPRYERGFFGLSPEESEQTARRAILEEGVPAEGLTLVRSVYSTWDEGRQARDWIEAHPGVERVLVVSNPFHMRRVRAVWRNVLEDVEDPPEVICVPVPWERTGLSVDDWWTREDELLWVFTEYVKLILYHLRYF